MYSIHGCYMQTTILKPNKRQEPSEVNSQKQSQVKLNPKPQAKWSQVEPKAKNQRPKAKWACKWDILAPGWKGKIYIHVYTYVYMCVCVCVFMYMCIYIYTHIHIPSNELSFFFFFAKGPFPPRCSGRSIPDIMGQHAWAETGGNGPHMTAQCTVDVGLPILVAQELKLLSP